MSLEASIYEDTHRNQFTGLSQQPFNFHLERGRHPKVEGGGREEKEKS